MNKKYKKKIIYEVDEQEKEANARKKSGRVIVSISLNPTKRKRKLTYICNRKMHNIKLKR